MLTHGSEIKVTIVNRTIWYSPSRASGRMFILATCNFSGTKILRWNAPKVQLSGSLSVPKGVDFSSRSQQILRLFSVNYHFHFSKIGFNTNAMLSLSIFLQNFSIWFGNISFRFEKCSLLLQKYRIANESGTQIICDELLKKVLNASFRLGLTSRQQKWRASMMRDLCRLLSTYSNRRPHMTSWR